MGKKTKRSMWGDGESSSSSSSSTDDKLTDEITRTRRRSEGRRKNRKKEGEAISMLALTTLMEEKMSKLIIENHKMLEKLITKSHNDLVKQLDLMKDDVSEIRKQLDKVTESHNDQCKQLDHHTHGTSSDTSASLRSQLNQVQEPRYKLKFQDWQIGESVEKDQIIKISVSLVDIYNGQTLQNGSLASAKVELVVVDANFDKNDNNYDWSREEFESSIIKKAREENSAMRNVDQSLKSIVSNGRFELVRGSGSHSGSKIFRNSSNKKVRLGVMVVWPTEERVLEGLSKPFLVRGHDRPGRQSNKSNRQRQALINHGFQEPNGTMPNMQKPSWENSTQDVGIREPELHFQGSTTMISQEQPQVLIQQYQCMEQARKNRADGNEWSSALVDFVRDPNFMDDDYVPDAIGREFMDQQRLFPVELIWDRPNVEPSKHCWKLLDQFMPLHSCRPKSNEWVLPSMRLMSEHFGSLTIVSKNVMQTCRRGGVLIEPLEPDDSDDERRPLKSKLHNKYRLRFVNKVCEAYFTWEQIKAFDGRDLKVALFDENDMRITSGTLSSASVEVVALHGDFDVDGQRYWTREEFSCCVVCPRHGKEASVLGGDRILVLADGEACLGDTFFQRTSFCARTGMFKLGVRLASAQEERIQEAISEPFLVKDRPSAGLPLGFLYPTDEELMVHIPCRDAAAASHFSVPFMADDRNKLKSVRRLGTLDGRKLAPDEDPQVIPSRRPMKTSPLTVSTLTSASASLLALPASVPVKEDSFPVISSLEISKPGKSEASGSSAENEDNAIETLEAEDIKQTEKEKARLKDEQLELAIKADELTPNEQELTEERAAAEMEPPRPRWEQKAKAMEAEEQKKNRGRAEFNGQPTSNVNGREQQNRALEKAHSLVLLLATLTAAMTYQAGLNPPGGLWQENGDPIPLTKNHRRYKAFYYCNSIAFVASLVTIVLVRIKTLYHHNALKAAMILDLFGLMGAYAAGSSRDVSTSIYAMALAGAVLFYVGIHVVFLTLDHKDGSSRGHDEDSLAKERKAAELLKKRRKRLLLFAILAASITYQAGVAPPGGSWRSNDGVHTAGNPVMRDVRRPRYLAFFVASIVLIVLLLQPSLHEKPLWPRVINATVVLDLLAGLLIAYAAGSSRTWKTSLIVSALVVAALGYFAIHLALSWISRSANSAVVSASSQPNEQLDKETARST